MLGGQAFPDRFTLFLRTETPARLQRDVARLVSELEPRGALTHVEPARNILADDLAENRAAATAASAVSLLALALSAAGLYAAVAYVVSLRSREIGVRLAIGAQPYHAAWLVVRHALVLVSTGVIAGLCLALPIAQLMRASLPGISPFDPVSLVSAVLVLFVAAVAAAVLPALRAARIDPVRVLRSE
jgi:ABC-type lipoprotein release transport system permease subunit